MRILHVVSTLAPASGGPTSVIRDLATAQANAGHAVTVCTTDRGNPVREKLPREYLSHFYPTGVDLRAFAVQYASLLFSSGMAQWLRRALSDFDIVHIHGLYRFPPTYAAWQTRRQGLPYVVRPHGNLDPYLYGTSSAGSVRLKRLYERWFDLPNLHAAGAIHYTAEEERERASFLGLKAPSFVVPNGLDWARYGELPARGALRARWGLGEAPVVLFLGRLHFKKGLDLLIPAFEGLRRGVPDAQLVIAGPENDDYGRKVRGWVRERGLDAAVHFVGTLHGAEVVQAYVDADVFALPSYTENFGMTVAEAMACALPVVISDQVNIHAEVSGAGAGLVTACDAGEVTAALELLLRDADRRRAMGAAGRRLVQERFTWPAIVEQLTAEYQNVIDRHRGAGARRGAAAIAGGAK
ncbi:MAG TPA: glycosyltransferase [Gammaproteobacteria bacterium]|nr:glycosyltransferase [Gammaproteobacteria bacterium]